jgi:Cu-Zn family superoxide dismutase
MSALRQVAATVAMAGAASGLQAGPVLADPPGPRKIEVNGPTYTYDPAYSAVRTKVQVLSLVHSTNVTLDVSGFPTAVSGRRFGAHVHQKACGPLPADAGPHYQNPAAKGSKIPLAGKEIWLDFTVNEQGEAHSQTAVNWPVAPGQAGSVVIHTGPTDPNTGAAGDRVSCTTVPFGA